MIPTFDAIIEGRNPTDPYGLTFKIAKLDVPQVTASLMDRRANYPLVGRVTNFGREFQPTRSTGRQVVLHQLDTCEGITLPYDGTFGAYLDEPRSVVLIDGRVFSRMGGDQFYMQVQLPQALEVTKQLFGDKSLNNIFELRSLHV